MFYDNFSSLCEKNGISKSKVIEEIGLSTGNLPKWRKGGIPKAEILTKLADYFGVSVDYLLGKMDNKPEITDDDIKFALFGGDGEITDEMYNDVKNFAQFIKEKYKDKKE